ncbi:phosphoribosyltransferase [Gordonia sp. HNM0687]|uniref:Phosphoribosyltransferase n=1 Tax=Gordonia mangrovi TaxID=2665643 RepID=A0A6L7GMP6_9ACTN|nr:phosphoribosyltransferase family protein [Gordonia mangrovi]MXP21209.1 phosphoribosyltransferase [Gordonia mangrovi]UVF78260.1 phosphoribosyltransferase family protein [Gordonia mangrovi]
MTSHIFAGREYRNRVHAGRILAEHVERQLPEQVASSPHLMVVALPRGGVPVARQVAEHLDVPLDVLPVRKVGVPDQPELAAGAIACGDVVVTNDEIIGGLGITQSEWEAMLRRERADLDRCARVHRHGRAAFAVRDADVVVVDDGVATGATMCAAVGALQRLGAASVTVAVPLGPPGMADRFPGVEQVICPTILESFRGVCAAYDEFEPITDEDVRELLSYAGTR